MLCYPLSIARYFCNKHKIWFYSATYKFPSCLLVHLFFDAYKIASAHCFLKPSVQYCLLAFLHLLKLMTFLYVQFLPCVLYCLSTCCFLISANPINHSITFRFSTNWVVSLSIDLLFLVTWTSCQRNRLFSVVSKPKFLAM